MRQPRANATIELAATSIFIVIMAIFCFDASIMVYANSMLNEAARDAARCAALTDSAEMAEQAARVALSRHRLTVPFVSNLRLTAPVEYITTFTAPYNEIANPSGGPGTVSPIPYVKVSTSLDVKIPAPVAAFGAVFGAGNLTFNDVTTFPLLNTPSNPPMGTFDTVLPVWTGEPPNNYYPCLNPKASSPVAKPCITTPVPPVVTPTPTPPPPTTSAPPKPAKPKPPPPPKPPVAPEG